jgi:hypothetical protein
MKAAALRQYEANRTGALRFLDGHGAFEDFIALQEKLAALDVEAANRLRSPERSVIVITHYQRVLDYIVPDVVHVLSKGRVVKTGGKVSR